MTIERKTSLEPKENRLSGVQLIITDWSGVISDDRPPVYESNMRMLQKRGIPRVSFDDWLPTTRLSPIEYLEEVYGLMTDREEVMQEYVQTFTEVRNEGIVPIMYADAFEVLEQIHAKGRQIMVVSSHPELHLKREAMEYGVNQFISSFQGNTKHKAEAIANAVVGSSIDRSSVLYMGDTVYDIQAAKIAGVISVGISTGYHMKERLLGESPDYVFGSLKDLLGKLVA